PSTVTTTMPASITNSPWAKLMASVALYTSTKPSALSEYISPIEAPLSTRANRTSRSSDILRRLPCRLGGGVAVDGDGRAQRRLAAVLESDLHGDVGRRGAAVERLDDAGVLLGDEAAADLAGTRHLGVVGVELLVQQQVALDLLNVGQGGIGLGDRLADHDGDLGLAAEVHKARVGKPLLLRPGADGLRGEGG